MNRKKLTLDIEESCLLCDVRCGEEIVATHIAYSKALDMVINPDGYLQSYIKNHGQPVIDLFTITHDEEQIRYEHECEEAERWVNERDREELDI